MPRFVRFFLLIGGILMMALAAGYFFQMPWAINTWPWPDGRLSYIFIASIQAAIAAAMIWISYSGDWGSLPAGALNLFVMLGGSTVFLYQYLRIPNLQMLPLAVISLALFTLASLALFLFLFRRPAASTIRMPRVVRISFGIFVILLIASGSLLVTRTANIMPWPLKDETSVMFGWIFLGDAFYFLYALLRPYWTFARAQLWSFLIYDLVLIIPFTGHFQRVDAALLPNLIIYLVVLLYSGGLAVYYLLIHKPTRIWSRPQSAALVQLPDSEQGSL